MSGGLAARNPSARSRRDIASKRAQTDLLNSPPGLPLPSSAARRVARWISAPLPRWLSTCDTSQSAAPDVRARSSSLSLETSAARLSCPLRRAAMLVSALLIMYLPGLGTGGGRSVKVHRPPPYFPGFKE